MTSATKDKRPGPLARLAHGGKPDPLRGRVRHRAGAGLLAADLGNLPFAGARPGDERCHFDQLGV